MLRWVLAIVLAVWLMPAQSQNWYEVEIIVFSQSHPDLYSPGATEEQWPDSFKPDWPEPLIRLNSAASPSPALRPLPTASRRMNNDAYALRATSGYELLWHQAWLQPMLDESHAPWIQIQAGTEQEGRFTLEGALRIYLERFLHMDAELWLSEFSLREEQDMPDVATLSPAFELPAYKHATPACAFYTENWPAEVTMEIPDLEPGNMLENWWFPPFDCSNEAIAPSAGLPLAQAVDPYIRVELPTIYFETLNNFDSGPVQTQEVKPLFIENSPMPTTLGEQNSTSAWQVSQIIPLSQSRRMRSGELHYVDHPRLGILALITPVEAPVIDLQEQPASP